MFNKAIWKKTGLIFIIAFIIVGLLSCGIFRPIPQPVIVETKEEDGFPTKAPPIIEVQPSKTPPIIEIQPSETLVNLPEVTPESDIPGINILEGLRKELAYGGYGGGGPPPGLQCEEPTSPSNSSLPAIQGACRLRSCLRDAEYTCNENTYILYLFGFPFYQVIQLELYDPSGKLAGNDEFIVEEFDSDSNFGWIESIRSADTPLLGEAITIGEIEVLKINLWMPAWKPVGVWHAIARSGNLFAEGSFTVQPPNRFPALSITTTGEYPPLEGPSQTDSFTAGQEFYILGTGFQPDMTYALGIYYVPWGNDFIAELVNGISVKADEDGVFFSSMIIENSDPPGEYLAYIDFDLSYEDVSEAGVFVSFTVPFWQPCSDGSLSYLGLNKTASVNANSPEPAALLAEPSTQAETTEQLQPGEYVTILDGPECQEGMVWWLVESSDTGLSGWMPEADAERYWLVP